MKPICRRSRLRGVIQNTLQSEHFKRVLKVETQWTMYIGWVEHASYLHFQSKKVLLYISYWNWSKLNEKVNENSHCRWGPPAGQVITRTSRVLWTEACLGNSEYLAWWIRNRDCWVHKEPGHSSDRERDTIVLPNKGMLYYLADN